MSENFDKQLVVPVPNERQMAILNMGYYNFIHFGINTFTHKEWGSRYQNSDLKVLILINGLETLWQQAVKV